MSRKLPPPLIFLFFVLMGLMGQQFPELKVHKKKEAPPAAAPVITQYYSCPQHPQVRSEVPGLCPLCQAPLSVVIPVGGTGGQEACPGGKCPAPNQPEQKHGLRRFLG